MTTVNATVNHALTVNDRFDLQDEISKIKYYYEVQEELTHSIALILHSLNVQSTDPFYHEYKNSTRIKKTEYTKIAHQNRTLPALLSVFLFQPTYQLELYDTLIQQIKNKQIKNVDDFIHELNQQLFHSPQLPPLFQNNIHYKTLKNHLEPLYEIMEHI